jgi:hypothetical protein
MRESANRGAAVNNYAVDRSNPGVLREVGVAALVIGAWAPIPFGSVKKKRHSLPTSDFTQIRPPWRWTTVLHNARPIPLAFVLTISVQLPEQTEDFICIFHIETNAVIAHAKHQSSHFSLAEIQICGYRVLRAYLIALLIRFEKT